MPPYELYTQLFTESSCIEFRCTCDSKCEYACSSIIPSSRSVGVLTSAVENFKRSFRRLPLVTLALAPPPERCFNPTEVSLTWVVLGPLEMRSVRLSREDPQKKTKECLCEYAFDSLTQTRIDEIVGYFERNILNQVCGFM